MIPILTRENAVEWSRSANDPGGVLVTRQPESDHCSTQPLVPVEGATMAETQHTDPPQSVRALCPNCGRLATDVAVDGTIVVAHFLCPLGHGWQSKWSQAVL